jgi:hypothetical protein
LRKVSLHPEIPLDDKSTLFAIVLAKEKEAILVYEVLELDPMLNTELYGGAIAPADKFANFDR